MRALYPEININQEYRFKVDDIHELYVEECGNPNGTPVIFIHGGPGCGCEAKERRFFDPEKYRIILFDQRGSGRSTPYACLENNTTQHLLGDIELIREKLAVDKWVVFGGSWGSTLSLVYAETYPERVKALVVRGIFFGAQRDFDWLYGIDGGCQAIFHDFWQEFLALVPEAKRNDIVKAYYEMLHGDDKALADKAALAWSTWEGRTASLEGAASVIDFFTDPHVALAVARIETHYFVNNCFLEENQILNNIERIADIPGVIAHGRYDALCPARNAYLLHQAWPKAEIVYPVSGHSSMDPALSAALVTATDKFAD